MKSKILCLMALLCLLLADTSLSQTNNYTDEELHELYWTYRNRFKLYFTHIGSGKGESLVIDARLDDGSIYGWCDGGYIHAGDGSSFLGFYISLLATEYKLLNDANQPTQEILNELYYAIRAAKRLDEGAENHWDSNEPLVNLNGFFNRDDLNESTHKFWQKNNTTMTESDAYVKKHKDANGNCIEEPKHPFAAEMSKDQFACLVMGFALVEKFVPNVYVKPTTLDEGFKLVDEVKAFVNRYMDFVFTNVSYTYANKCALATSPYNITITRNLFLQNPANGNSINYIYTDPSKPAGQQQKVINRGGDLLDMALSLCLASQKVTGIDYTLRNFFYKTAHANSVCLPQVEEHQTTIRDFYDDLPPSFSIHGVLSGINRFAIEPSPLTLLDNARIDQKAGQNNANVYLPLWATSNAYANSDVISLVNNLNMEGFYLIRGILNDISYFPPQWDENFWVQRLSTVSKYHNPFQYEFSNFFKHSNSFQHSKRIPDEEQRGFFSGLDFMLTYNLYRIFFQNQSLPLYKESSCDCGNPTQDVSFTPPGYTQLESWQWKNPTIETSSQFAGIGNTQNILSSGTFETERYHDDYVEKDIRTKSYLSLYDYQVKDQGILHMKSDVALCNNKTLSVFNNGKLVVGGDLTNEVSEFRVKKGTQLFVYSDGEIIVKNNSRLIIEAGAMLILGVGNKITLEGANSILENQGVISVGPVTTFKPEGNGYVLFNNLDFQELNNVNTPNGYNIINEGGNGIVDFSSITLEKKVEVASNTVLKVAPSILFKLDNVLIECGFDAGIKISGASVIQKCQFRKLPSIQDQYVYNGLTFFGQKEVKIWNCSFHNAKRAISNYMGSNQITATICEFNNCNTAIETWKSGGNFIGSNFKNNLQVWVDPSAFRFTTFEHNFFENNVHGIQISGGLHPFVGFMGNIFKDNVHSIVTKRSTDVSLVCNQFKDNLINGGVYMGNSSLGASVNSPFQIRTTAGDVISTGHNIFSAGSALPKRGILMTENTRYRFDQGYNSFINDYGTSAVFHYSIYGDFYRSANGSTNPDINFVNNYWQPTPVGYSSVNILDVNQSYTTKHFDLNFKNSPVEIYGYAKTTNSTCPVTQWSDALDDPALFSAAAISYYNLNGTFEKGSPVHPGGGTTEIYTTSQFPATPTLIASGTYSGLTFNVAAKNALLATYNGGEDVDGLQVSLSSLLEVNSLLQQTIGLQNEADEEIWELLYGQYTSLLVEAKFEGTFEGNSILESMHLNAAISLCDAALTSNENMNALDTSKYNFVKSSLNFDKSNLYSLFNDHQNAIQVLDNMEVFVRNEDITLLQVMRCISENDKLLEANTITKFEHEESVRNCILSFSVNYPENIGASNNSIDNTDSLISNSATYIIVPNPATTQITLDVTQHTSQANIDVAIYNKFGINMTGMLNQGIKNQGQYSITIPVSGWDVDVYTAILFVDGQPIGQHFIKLTE